MCETGAAHGHFASDSRVFFFAAVSNFRSERVSIGLSKVCINRMSCGVLQTGAQLLHILSLNQSVPVSCYL